jgi:hypothetical protein
MAHATVEIAGVEIEAEYDFTITHSGCSATWDDPAEPAEFDIEVLRLRFSQQAADVPDLEIPEWLKDLLNQHLAERDDINDVVQAADMERDDDD